MAASGLQLPRGDDSDEFSDDDVDGETKPLTGRLSSSAEPPPLWDGFLDPPPANSSKSENPDKCMEVTVRILKVVTYILTFLIVLAGGVISKGLMLLMTSQLKVNRNVTMCSSQIDVLDNRKDYVATLPLEENVAWAWMLFFAYITPEVGTFIRSFRMCLFKGYVGKFLKGQHSKRTRVLDVLVVSLFEVLHTLGVGLLVYVVLPDMDSIRGAMLTNCVAFVPGLIGMLSRDHNEDNIFWKVWMDVLALVCQCTGFIVWPIVETWNNSTSVLQMWIIPLALFLASFGWWENYVDSSSSRPVLRLLGGVKQRLWQSRYFTYMFVSLLKCLVFFTVMVAAMGWRMDFDFETFFDLNAAFKEHAINASEVRVILSESLLPEVSVDPVAPVEIKPFLSSGTTPVNVFLIQLFTAYLCYIFGKFACKICIQGFSFALPVNVTVPVTISLLIAACGVRTENFCAFKSLSIPGYLFWEYKDGEVISDFLRNDFAWVWLLWLVSQTWIALHIWTPKCERLASTEKLFVSPMYNSLLVDQSLALNRRKDDDPEVKADELNAFGEDEEKEFCQHYEPMSNSESPENINMNAPRKADAITKIYACATMWHENREEMMEFLKSIMRMDEDQSARRLAVKWLNVAGNDYYEFETHIFFDDAFELSDKNEEEHVVNGFVKLLAEQIDEAVKYVHQASIRVRPPKKIPTPYGGRLVWTLPGKTKIVTHLKDKDKIRHKKRWSQVMYMYYLLGFKLMDQNDISLERKEVIAENTLLLALDGDIDFTPKAVTLLVDLMKKNSNLGAACGRIHPIGSGLMVWYQMFEYAVGHWLQKATEHIIGCVLCSPGCFSLFRGRALMDDSIMKKYTTVSTQARHYVQYDQGEDRWLCTLLLQQGYRVEYCAASDAYTHCPEGFGEFYNQRRRWVPSTMANIMDLLQDYKMTVKRNDNISMLYIAYQTMLMVGTILGPGTIFLMLVGAFVAAFPITNGTAFIYNLVPILLFMIVCFCAKSANQIKLAYLLTAFYALVMCMVAVALALNIVLEGSNTPSAIFLYATAASFVITALLHPQEFWCLPTGLVYYLVVPSMYLLLQIYSLFNLNDVSWGTRDVPVKMTKEEQIAVKKAMEEAEKKRKQGGILAMLNKGGDNKDEGSIEFNLAGLFKVMCCIYPKPDETRHIALAIDDLKKKFDNLERHLGVGPARRRSTLAPRISLRSGGSGTTAEPEDDDGISLGDVSETSVVKEERDDLVNPYWLEDENLSRKGEVDYLPSKEVQFWKDLIAKYLFPLNKNEADQKKAARELKELRNIAVFSFSMMNAIFVIIVFLLQMNKDTIHINWPVGIKTNITYSHNDKNKEIFITKEFLQLEPIGLVFVFFFAIILAVQFTAMLFHRFGTFSHILSSTEISCGSTSSDPEISASTSDKEALEAVRKMQKLQGINGEYQSDNSAADKAGRRRTIANIARQQTNRQNIASLDVAFRKRMDSLVPDAEDDTEQGLQRRRDTIRAFGQSSSQKRKLSFASNPRNSRSTSFATPVIEEEA